MKNVLILGTAVMLLMSSCASLTKSQVQAVNQFAKTSKNFSAYPSKILVSVADLRMRRGLYAANIVTNAELHVGELESIFAQRQTDLAITADVNITFEIIDTYAQSLLLLSSDRYAADLAVQSANFGVSLDSLITTYNGLPGVTPVHKGIGGLIGSLIMQGGTQFIRSKQAKEIKRFVPEADELISVMTTNLINFLKSGKIAALIDNEQREVHNIYMAYLNKLQSANLRPTLNDERDYLEMITDLDHIKTLRDQTRVATENLRRAHHKLLDEIKEKKTLTEMVSELQLLYDNVKDVKATISAINTAKN